MGHLIVIHKIKHGWLVIFPQNWGLQQGVILHSSQYYHFT